MTKYFMGGTRLAGLERMMQDSSRTASPRAAPRREEPRQEEPRQEQKRPAQDKPAAVEWRCMA